MQKIKMRVVNWYTPDTEANFNNNYIVQLLRTKYDIEYSHEPDYIIFGVFNLQEKTYLEYDCVRIFWTGENARCDYNVADYSIDFDFTDYGDRHLRFAPYFNLINLGKNRPKNDRQRFCAYIVSNGGCLLRENFFDKLSLYKRVDSGGKHRNNIKQVITDKHKWLCEYKFNICFENASFPGYLTEKLFQAFNAGCVPIYWGDTSLRVGAVDRGYDIANPYAIDTRLPQISEDLFDFKLNPKAFINAHDFVNLDELVDEVRRIDNDKKAYEAMRNEDLVLNNFDAVGFYREKVLGFFDKIFAQGPKLALRRGKAAFIL